jgi:branched-chain amino acid transport system permease protein
MTAAVRAVRDGRGPARNLAIFVLAAVLPLIFNNGGFVNFLADAGAFVLLALGLNIVVGFAGLLDLGYAAFFAIGSYAFAMLASPQFGIHVPFWVLLFVASGIAAVFGILLGAPTLRLRGDYLAIVTLGFGEIVPQTFLNLSQWTGGPNGIGSLDQPTFFGYRFGFHVLPYYYLILVLIVVAVVVANNLRTSRLGRAWMAIREDETAAKAMGINVRNVKLLAFGLGATFGGIAGSMFGAFQGFVSPESFSLMESVIVLSMVVLGGLGHIPGVVFGAVLLAVFPEVLRHTVAPVQEALFGHILIDAEVLRMLLYGIALVVIMLYRPRGLWPAPLHGSARALPQNAAPSGAASLPGGSAP